MGHFLLCLGINVSKTPALPLLIASRFPVAFLPALAPYPKEGQGLGEGHATFGDYIDTIRQSQYWLLKSNILTNAAKTVTVIAVWVRGYAVHRML